MKTLRFVCLSDTHGHHNEIDIPPGDVLLHAGDISSRGKLDQIRDFNFFLGTLPHTHKIIIAGNHDFGFEKDPDAARALIVHATYLQDEAIEIDGIKIYGSPWQPEFHNWAFNLKRGAELRAKWDQIPADTDILLTHGPPYGILDRIWSGAKVGCVDLLARVQAVRPKLHLFGHIHEAAGYQQVDDIHYVNAAIEAGIIKGMLRRYNKPFLFDMNVETKEITLLGDN